jgi:hypothetical protein
MIIELGKVNALTQDQAPLVGLDHTGFRLDI